MALGMAMLASWLSHHLVQIEISQQLLNRLTLHFVQIMYHQLLAGLSDFHVSLRMNCNNFGDPLTFHLAPSSRQNFNLSSALVYDQIPVKLITFPSASAFVFSAN